MRKEVLTILALGFSLLIILSGCTNDPEMVAYAEIEKVLTRYARHYEKQDWRAIAELHAYPMRWHEVRFDHPSEFELIYWTIHYDLYDVVHSATIEVHSFLLDGDRAIVEATRRVDVTYTTGVRQLDIIKMDLVFERIRDEWKIREER